MLLTPKVKSRFPFMLVGCLAGVVALRLVAQEPTTSQSIGELAVSKPRPPVLVPPLLDQAGLKPVSVKVDLRRQRLLLLVGGDMAIDSPITSGRKNMRTPSGRFEVERKEASRRQDEYGNLVDAEGQPVLEGVYASLDPPPSGLEFRAVVMKHVLFLKGQRFMIHAGEVGSLPTSDGSIIVPAELAKTLFGKIPVGCPIEIIGD